MPHSTAHIRGARAVFTAVLGGLLLGLGGMLLLLLGGLLLGLSLLLGLGLGLSA